MHTCKLCKYCADYHTIIQSTFPTKKKNQVSKSKHKPLASIKSQAKAFTTVTTIKPLKRELKDIGEAIYKTFDEACKENLGCSFTDVLLTVPSKMTGLQQRISPAEKKERKRDEQRKVKTSIESVWKNTDTDSHLALRQSFSARQQQRLSTYFETTDQAEDRIRKTPPEKLMNKSHVPSPSTIEGEFDRLKEDMESWPREEVNWSEKAREYKIRRSSDQATPPNAGQILKEYLKSQEIDTSQFEKQKGNIYNMYTEQLLFPEVEVSSGGYLLSHKSLSGKVNIHHYSPPLWGIIVLVFTKSVG